MQLWKMLAIAKERLKELENDSDLPEAQVCVLITSKGQIALVENNDYASVIEVLTKEKDCVIKQMVAVWKSGGIEIPSYALRKAFYQADAKNATCRIYFSGDHFKILQQTL